MIQDKTNFSEPILLHMFTYGYFSLTLNPLYIEEWILNLINTLSKIERMTLKILGEKLYSDHEC